MTSVLIFALLAFLPTIAFPAHGDSSYPYVPYLPFPFPELLVSMAFWTLSHFLRDPIYAFSFVIFSPFPALLPALPIILSTTVHSILTTFLRLAPVPILLIPHHMTFAQPTSHDQAFRRVWWVALGWAATEAVVGVKQGYDAIALYRDALVTVRKVPQLLSPNINLAKQADFHGRSGGSSPHNGPSTAASSSHQGLVGERQSLLPSRRQEFQIETALQMEVDHDLDQLMALKGREELEEVYGMPVIVSSLWRSF